MLSESPEMRNGLSRVLAGGGDALVIDYTVLAMAIMALSLLMIVEIMRHKIDHFVHEKVFFAKLLDLVYRELSTLGTVEAVIFLIHHYGSINLVKERVFAEVHFTIFFVAIINAIQCSILYLLSLSVAEKQWVKIEAMDIDHYVAIRRQFDIVDNLLRNKENKYKSINNESIQHRDKRSLYEQEENWFKNCIEYLKYSSLKSKHKRLLVQVRFHELRVHFIELNQLHPKFSVADYLKLSLNDVFEKLVCISTTAWLSLIMFANIILLSMNLVAEKARTQPIGIVLTTIYLAYGAFFLFLSVLVQRKVRNIFFRIMRDKKWITREGEEKDKKHANEKQNPILSERSFNSENLKNYHQLSYFWGNDPQHIVAAAQFMQFGFGIPFAILLVFNNTIFGDDTLGWRGWYILAPFLGYSCFVGLWSRIIPQFTQCTSLGELVKRKHLIQIEAKLKLSTAKRKRKEEIDHIKAESKRAESENILSSVKNTTALLVQPEKTHSASSTSGSERLLKISDYVKKPTKDLPNSASNVPNKRRRRRKTVSDGVAAMRLFSPTSLAAKEALQDFTANDSIKPTLPPTEPRRRRQKAVSAGVLLMRAEKSLPTKASEGNLDSLMEGIPSRSGTVQHGKQSMISTSGKQVEVTLSDTKENQKLEYVCSENKYRLMFEDYDDDDLSDVVPDIAQPILKEQEMKESTSFLERLQSIYLSINYRLISAVFGTMLTFFMLTWRMAMILLDTCTIINNQNMWNFIHRSVAFWINVGLLSLFIIESFMMCVIFGKKDFKPDLVIAGVFDIALSGMCLALLLWAEFDRCCDCAESNMMSNAFNARTLGQESSGGYFACEGIIECCPVFGTRLCGGIGNVEPCTSIIILRIGRFIIGENIYRFYQMCTVSSPTEMNEDVNGDHTKMYLNNSPMNENSNIEKNTGVISDLWIKAITDNPDIVEKHGVFSGALLEAMLGIKAPDVDTRMKNVAEVGKDIRKNDQLNKTAHEEGKGNENIVYPDIQSYIEAGKSLKPSQGSVRSLSHHESEDANHFSNLFGYNELEEFSHPASVLLRSMRRCQCKLLPLLDEWTTVDIVLTEHEIVWFDVKSTPLNHEDIPVMEPVKGAIRKTKGGRGLRLCDVAIGRTVLGRMPITDIDNVKIQRLLVTKGVMNLDENNDEENMGTVDSLSKEYWENGDISTTVYDSETLLKLQETKWHQITEDRLKIHSTKGALFLARFFADLRREEMSRSKAKTGAPVFANRSAIIWCQSISHLCGNSQLKQKLPHFGEDLDQELIDFLEVVERH